MKEKFLTIKKVSFTGKWIEFWFFEEEDESGSYLHSCKIGEFWDLVENKKIYNHIMNCGLFNIKTVWVYNAPNWNLKNITK